MRATDGNTLVRHLEHRINVLHKLLGKDYNSVVLEVAQIVADTFQACDWQGHWTADDYRAELKVDLFDAVQSAMQDLCLVVADDLHTQCLCVARILELREDLHSLWVKDLSE